MFSGYLERWALVPDGDAIVTHSSRLLPVKRIDGAKAMLKVSTAYEEQCGARLMVWWNGDGAAPILAHAGDALLLERADTEPSLSGLVRDGYDDEASRILCKTVASLHGRKTDPPKELVPLEEWFESLFVAARTQGGILRQSAEIAEHLLKSQRDIVVLHGDIHHGNVLHFGDRGWLAIDPKGLIGERCFDYANLFCNPDRETALKSGRVAFQANIVCQAAGLDRERLLKWILAWSGLSASWMLEEENPEAETRLEVARLAAAELRR